jgi:glycosyltransferase involved in cell wall biosynthesis
MRVIVNAWSSPIPAFERSAARARLGLDGSQFTIGWVGRLSHEKGADVLVEALALLPQDVSVSFIGDGRERDVLVALAEARGVTGRVRWHGIIPDAGALLNAFDTFVLSSRTEGTPMTLLEAMGARVPIVATRVGGVPDVVTEADALLVPPEDPAAIATAVQAIRDEPTAAAIRSTAARQRLEDAFAIEPWLVAYEDLYHGIIERVLLSTMKSG